MNISRYNYEEYFLLFIDNELTEEECASVEKFVEENPDLREELNLLRQSVINPEKDIVFANKEALIHASSSSFITVNNYEEYFILYVDDELNNSEKAQVELFVYQHPELQAEFELLQKIKLVPEKIAFPSKHKLYKSESRKVVSMAWFRGAAAAIILVIAGTIWIFSNRTSTQTDTFAGNQPKKVEGQTKTNTVDINKSKNVESQAAKTDTNAQVEERIQTGKFTEEEPAPVAAASVKDIQKKSVLKVESALTQKMIQKENSKEMQIAIIETKLSGKNITAGLDSNDSKGQVVTAKIDDAVAKTNIIIDQPMQVSTVSYQPATAVMASHESRNVFLTNIPLDNNPSLRGLFRKASRLIDKVNTVKTRNRSGIFIGNVEIAIQ